MLGAYQRLPQANPGGRDGLATSQPLLHVHHKLTLLELLVRGRPWWWTVNCPPSMVEGQRLRDSGPSLAYVRRDNTMTACTVFRHNDIESQPARTALGFLVSSQQSTSVNC